MRRLLVVPLLTIACGGNAPAKVPASPGLPPGMQCSTEQCTFYASYPDAPEWSAAPKRLGDTVVCEFRGATYATFDDVPDGAPSPQFELKPGEVLRLTFKGMNGDKPRLIGNRGEAQLEVLKATDAEWLLVEHTALGTPVLYQISQLTRSAIWSKAYTNLRGRPFGFLSVGRCF